VGARNGKDMAIRARAPKVRLECPEQTHVVGTKEVDTSSVATIAVLTYSS